MDRQRIVITGASSGIGEALALEYAGTDTSLVLLGRDVARLGDVAAACRARGAVVETHSVDIRDRDATASCLDRVDETQPIDLLIANAGVQKPTVDDPGDNASAFVEIETNLLGALNAAVPVSRRMAGRGRGQIALMSSLAAYAPLPDSPGYSASKAGLLVYGLALRARLRPAGIRVNVICPGYIDAGMGRRNKGWQPFTVPVGRTAATIRRGLAADRAVVAFPFPLSWIARATQFVPEWLSRAGLRAFRFRVERQAHNDVRREQEGGTG